MHSSRTVVLEGFSYLGSYFLSIQHDTQVYYWWWWWLHLAVVFFNQNHASPRNKKEYFWFREQRKLHKYYNTMMTSLGPNLKTASVLPGMDGLQFNKRLHLSFVKLVSCVLDKIDKKWYTVISPSWCFWNILCTRIGTKLSLTTVKHSLTIFGWTDTKEAGKEAHMRVVYCVQYCTVSPCSRRAVWLSFGHALSIGAC